MSIEPGAWLSTMSYQKQTSLERIVCMTTILFPRNVCLSRIRKKLPYSRCLKLACALQRSSVLSANFDCFASLFIEHKRCGRVLSEEYAPPKKNLHDWRQPKAQRVGSNHMHRGWLCPLTTCSTGASVVFVMATDLISRCKPRRAVIHRAMGETGEKQVWPNACPQRYL